MSYHGRDGASHQMYTMDASDVRALVDGRYFLERGGPFLARMALEPICRQCDAVGLPSTVAFTVADSTVDFRCAHIAGWVARNRHLELPELFSALGWTLRCSRCRQPARADNAATDAAFTVECACTTRIMANPLAKAANLFEVARLDRPEPVC